MGAGYWGPNLVRNFAASEEWRLRWVCDVDEHRAEQVARRSGGVPVTSSLASVLDDDDVGAIAVATPADSHAEVAIAALEAGKHVLVEKPLASSLADGEKMVAAAEERGLVLMCDHTYCYTPVVQRIKELIDSGALGCVQYVDAVRVNLGLVQPHIDVFWDLAPHDLSILDFILPADRAPLSVAAQGADPIGSGQACVGYLTLPLRGGAIAHAHVNWLSPTKVRTMIIGGSKRMLFWDDLQPSQRLSMYDKGIEIETAMGAESRRERLISYRVGDMVAPALPEQEALQGVVGEFARCIVEGGVPATDGRSGLRVLRMLEAASASIANGGQAEPLGDYR